MKKIRMAFLAMFAIIAFGACTEVPVKQVEQCAKVVDIEMFREYFIGNFFGGPVYVYEILDNGKRVKIDEVNYYHQVNTQWLRNIKMMKIGTNHCWIEYEKLK
ncbi:MAG: hypothetical protein HYV51_03105 [Parcubacteria group bacterium]|nr:hypothetical protein [Parcubacteria group bacterium]